MKPIDYIKGDRRGRDAHRTEVEAMRDPLLHDAIEGFDSVGGDHEQTVARLQERVRARTAVKPHRRAYRWASVAAVALLAVATGSLYMLMRGQSERASYSVAYESGEGLGNFRNMEVETLRVMTQAQRETATRQSAEVVAAPAEHMAADRAVHIEETVEMVAAEAETGNAMSEEIHREEELLSEVAVEYMSGAAMRKSEAQLNRSMSAHITGNYDVNGLMEIPAAQLDSLTAVRSFGDFVENNRHVPRDASGMPISGIAVVEFTADSQGRPRDIQVLESPDPAATRETKRLIRKAPEWPNERTIRVVVEF